MGRGEKWVSGVGDQYRRVGTRKETQVLTSCRDAAWRTGTQGSEEIGRPSERGGREVRGRTFPD